jgi:hypothetical protein
MDPPLPQILRRSIGSDRTNSPRKVMASFRSSGFTAGQASASTAAVIQYNPKIAPRHFPRTLFARIGSPFGATQQEPRRQDGGRSAQDATATPVITIGYGTAAINPENNSDAIVPHQVEDHTGVGPLLQSGVAILIIWHPSDQDIWHSRIAVGTTMVESRRLCTAGSAHSKLSDTRLKALGAQAPRCVCLRRTRRHRIPATERASVA